MCLYKEHKKILKKVLVLFKPYKKKIIIILMSMIFSAGISIMLPLLSKRVIDNGIMLHNFSQVVELSVVSFALFLLDQGIGFLETRYRIYVGTMISYSLTQKAFKHVLKLKIKYFNHTNFAEIMNNITMDVRNVSSVADRSVFFAVMQVFKMIGGVVGLLLIDWKLTFLVICIVPVRYQGVKFLARKRNETFKQYMQCYSEYSSWYGDTISGIKEIKLWGMERVKTGQFVKKQRGILKSNIRIEIIDRLNEFSESLMFNLLSNLMYIFGAYMIFHSSLTLGGFFAFTTFSLYVTMPISAIMNIGYMFSNIFPSAERLFEFLDMEGEESKRLEVPVRIDRTEVPGKISFSKVSFSYQEGECTINNLDFDIKAGEKIAVIGENGSGKSTLINLLLRFYQPKTGTILLDGKDINSIHIRDYRQLFSVVSQDLYLFDGTIKENVLLAPQKDDIKLFKSLKDSGAYNFIESLPLKHDSRVGRNGAELSGGERQKVAVARALARDANFLILDEATSSYDIGSENSVNELFSKKLKDVTVIAVTHRPSLLKQVDRIILLEQGGLEDMGTHNELYDRNDRYRRLFNSFGEKKNRSAG